MDVGGRSQNHAAAFGTGLYESATRFPEPNQRTNSLLSAEIVADLDFAQLTVSSGLSNYDDIGQRDQTDLLITLQYAYEEFPSFSAFTREIEEEETFSQEIRLVSQNDGKWNWIAGLFFMDFEQPGADSREFTPGFDVYAGGSRPDSLEYIRVIREDLTQRAVFGEISYDVTDRWQLTLGARNYSYDFEASSAADLPLANTVFGGAPPDQIELDFGDPAVQDEDGTLFKFNTSYRFNDDVMGYFTISEGYRLGSSNGIPLCTTTGGQQNVCAQPAELEFRPDTTQELRDRPAQPVARPSPHLERRAVLHRLAGSAARVGDGHRCRADHGQRRGRGVEGPRSVDRHAADRSFARRPELRAHDGRAHRGCAATGSRLQHAEFRNQPRSIHRRPAGRSAAGLARRSGHGLLRLRLDALVLAGTSR